MGIREDGGPQRHQLAVKARYGSNVIEPRVHPSAPVRSSPDVAARRESARPRQQTDPRLPVVVAQASPCASDRYAGCCRRRHARRRAGPRRRYRRSDARRAARRMCGRVAVAAVRLGPGDGCRSCPAITTVTWLRRSTSLSGCWREYFRGDDGSAEFPFVRRRGSIALIGVDTAVPTRAVSRVWQRRRRAARASWRSLLDANRERRLFPHRAAASFAVARRPCATQALDRCAATSRDALTTHGAELVIHGHGHEERIDRLAGPSGPDARRRGAVGVVQRSVGRAGWNQYPCFGRMRVAGGSTSRLVATSAATRLRDDVDRETVRWDARRSAAQPRPGLVDEAPVVDRIDVDGGFGVRDHRRGRCGTECGGSVPQRIASDKRLAM